jgi:FkbM family methyltransferase
VPSDQSAPRTHLRRDGDSPDVTISTLLRRQLRECADDLGAARRVTDGASYGWLAPWVVAYHASYILPPLASHKTFRVSVEVNGRRLTLNLRRNSSDLHIFREVFLRGSLDAVVSHLSLDSARTIIDLGSNAGLAFAYLSCYAPRAAFYCADPSQENNDVAGVTATLNGICASLHAAAAAGHDGHVEFFPNRWWASSSTVAAVAGARVSRPTRFEHGLALPPVRVRAVSMNTFFAENSISHVDLMKIDIEGAEVDIVSGDCDWLDVVDAIAIETHPKYVDPAPVREALRRHGMRAIDASGPLEIFRSVRS